GVVPKLLDRLHRRTVPPARNPNQGGPAGDCSHSGSKVKTDGGGGLHALSSESAGWVSMVTCIQCGTQRGRGTTCARCGHAQPVREDGAPALEGAAALDVAAMSSQAPPERTGRMKV